MQKQPIATQPKMKVDARAALARINRAYRRSEDTESWVMKKTKPSHVGKWGLGVYGVLDTANNTWVELDASLEAEGRRLRALQPYEELAYPQLFRAKSKFMLLTPFNRNMRRFAGMVASRLGCEDEDALAKVLGNWKRLLWMYRKEFRQLTGTDILNRLDEYSPRWRPSKMVVCEDGQKYEVVNEVDEFFASIEENHGYLPPRRR